MSTRRKETTQLEDAGYKRYKARAVHLGMTVEAFANVSMILNEWYYEYGAHNGCPSIKEMCEEIGKPVSKKLRQDIRTFDEAIKQVPR